MAEENLVDLCREAIFLQQSANPAIEYVTDFPPAPVSLACDARQVGQALTNILKNAAESIEARLQLSGESEPPGCIQVTVRENADDLVIDIEDNGRGLPVQGRERLTEPYVTTRTKGTGLGLAIVKKIMEDHGGFLLLDDRPGGGAVVRLMFRRASPDRTLNVDSEESPDIEPARAHGS